MNQLTISLKPVKMAEVDSIGMGVLPNGETFLSLRGLARFCGLAPSRIIEFAQDWQKGEAQTKTRGRQVAQLIKEWTESDEIPSSLYVEIHDDKVFNGVIHAVPEQIVMAIIDYYAHYANPVKDEALQNYRKATRFGLRKYIYERLNYEEKSLIDQSWSLFQERILLNECPQGFFTMFNEATNIIASLIRHNIPVDDTIMVDNSLGIHWGKHWNSVNLENEFGERIKIIHKFPESYRQLDPEIWAYPITALSSFRIWFEEVYLPNKYPEYLKRKVKDGKVQLESVPLLLTAVMPPSVEDKRAKLITYKRF